MPITIQDTYLTDYATGFPGMLADGEVTNRTTGEVEDAAGLPFGRAAFKGTNRNGVTGTPGTKFKGVTIADAGVVNGIGELVDGYRQRASASLIDEGDIWVTAGSAVAVDAAVYVTAAGAFNSTSTGNTAIPATFLDAATAAGQPVRIRIVRQ